MACMRSEKPNCAPPLTLSQKFPQPCFWNCFNVPLINNNSTLYSSQREIKTVVWSYSLTHNEELNRTFLNNSVMKRTPSYTLLDTHTLSLNLHTLKDWSNTCEQVLFVYVSTIKPPRLTDQCNFITVLIVTREPEQTTLLFWSAACGVTPHGLHTADRR